MQCAADTEIARADCRRVVVRRRGAHRSVRPHKQSVPHSSVASVTDRLLTHCSCCVVLCCPVLCCLVIRADWKHVEPCQSLQARSSGGTWSVQSPLGGAVSEAATARVSIIDTAGATHVVATLRASCTTAGDDSSECSHTAVTGFPVFHILMTNGTKRCVCFFHTWDCI
jgi:hypothetical protein